MFELLIYTMLDFLISCILEIVKSNKRPVGLHRCLALLVLFGLNATGGAFGGPKRPYPGCLCVAVCFFAIVGGRALLRGSTAGLKAETLVMSRVSWGPARSIWQSVVQPKTPSATSSLAGQGKPNLQQGGAVIAGCMHSAAPRRGDV